MGLPKIRARLAEAKGLGCAQTQAWLTRSQGPHAFLDHFDCSFLGGQGELKNIEGLYHDWYRHAFKKCVGCTRAPLLVRYVSGLGRSTNVIELHWWWSFFMDFRQPLLCFQFLLSSLLLSVALEHRLGRQASKGLQSSKVEAGLSHTVTSQKDHRFSQSSAPQACAPMLESLFVASETFNQSTRGRQNSEHMAFAFCGLSRKLRLRLQEGRPCFLKIVYMHV